MSKLQVKAVYCHAYQAMNRIPLESCYSCFWLKPNAGQTKEDKDVQPPHRQAANYYREDVVEEDRFLVTMEEPNALNPKPIVIEIGSTGATLKSAGSVTIAAAVATAAPRAG